MNRQDGPNTNERTKVIITLVHGTWGNKKNAWYRPGSEARSGLTKKLSKKGISPEFHYIEWSGSNSLGGRRSGVKRLYTHLLKTRNDTQNTPHFVIAHSHGGNIASRAIQLARKKLKIDGLLTLSTPYLVASRYHISKFEKWAKWYFHFCTLMTIVGLGLALATYASNLTGEKITPAVSWFRILFGLSIIFLVRWTLRKAGGWKGFIRYWKLLPDRAVKFSNVGNDKDFQWLAIRSPGDEASIVISFGQLVEIFSRILRNFIQTLSTSIRDYVKRYKFLLKLLGVIFIMLVLMSIALGIDDHWTKANIREHEFFKHAIPVALFLFPGFYFLINAIMAVAGIFLVLLLLAYFISLLAMFAFGWEYPLLAWTVDHNAESVPLNFHGKLVLVKKKGRNGLYHSTYDSEEAQVEMANWIAKRVSNKKELKK